MKKNKRTVIIGYGDAGKYGIDEGNPYNVYFDRETDTLKAKSLTEMIKIAMRMGAERIICEDVERGC